MNNHIKPILEQGIWDDFVSQNSVTSFMQAWAWGEFEESCGHGVIRLGVYEGASLVSIVQVICIDSKRARFLFIPHGPLFHKDLMPMGLWGDNASSISYHISPIKVILECITHELKKIAIREKYSFVRLNSSLPQTREIQELVTKLGYTLAPLYLTSENAAVLSLAGQTLPSLLSHMRKTTRYLVNKAEKLGVRIEIDSTGKSLNDFMHLYTLTSSREKFVGFSEEYIRKEFEAFGKSGNATILTAYHEDTPQATALILFTKNSAFYHQGASNHPKVPAPYLLQWQAIQLAMQRGCAFYNFWGTYIPGRTPKSWQGLSLFKLGFGSTIWSYLPTHDLVLNKRSYFFTNLYERFIRLRRRV